MPALSKYWHVLNVGLQNNLTYRFNFLARTLFGLIPLTAVLFLWRTIYEGKGADATVSSYTLAQMISYYLLVTVVDALTAVNEDDWQIATDIKDGNISQFLLKPVDYLWFRFSLFVSGRITYLAVACIPILRLSGRLGDVRMFLCVAGDDGLAAILSILHDGDAGVLGLGGFHVYFHPLRL
jgi:ABC-2 type transport system permease protein